VETRHITDCIFTLLQL